MNVPAVVVTGGFDDLRSRHLRFLQEAAKLGPLHVLLWSDETLAATTGRAARFPVAERRYLLRSVRYVESVHVVNGADPDGLPQVEGLAPATWVDEEASANGARATVARRFGVAYHVLSAGQMAGFPDPGPASETPGRKKVVATGCYDWFHSGHVRFFEEVSAYGDLYVVVGHDANIRLLKGRGHPLLSAEERRYVTGSIRFVTQALVSSGDGWIDADPEIRRIRPDLYIVNEDGDKGGKREYCAKMGIQYVVLKREPAPGLQARTSTELRGF